jgi:hypothetical protein
MSFAGWSLISESCARVKSRPALSRRQQVQIFFRDQWLCHWCGRPVIFPPALNVLQEFVRSEGHSVPVAYFHPRWTRRDAPLLDHLGVVLDHVGAFSKGGATDVSNLVVACCKCNSLKSDISADAHTARYPKRRVKGRYGEPTGWDGLAAVFMTLARVRPSVLTAGDRKWLKVLEAHYGSAR